MWSTPSKMTRYQLGRLDFLRRYKLTDISFLRTIMQVERTSRSVSTLREREQKKSWSRPRFSAKSREMWLSQVLRRSTCKNGDKISLWDPSNLLSWLTKNFQLAMPLFWRKSSALVISQLSGKCKWTILYSSFPLFLNRQSSTMQTFI